MNRNLLHALLLSIGGLAVVYALLTRSLLLGILIVLFLLSVWLFYRLVVAVERIADNADQLAAATTDGGQNGTGRRSSTDRDDKERPPVEERSTDELFE